MPKKKICTVGEQIDKIVKHRKKWPSNCQKYYYFFIYFFCSFYVITSLHAKNVICRSNEVTCGQHKDKEKGIVSECHRVIFF